MLPLVPKNIFRNFSCCFLDWSKNIICWNGKPRQKVNCITSRQTKRTKSHYVQIEFSVNPLVMLGWNILLHGGKCTYTWVIKIILSSKNRLSLGTGFLWLIHHWKQDTINQMYSSLSITTDKKNPNLFWTKWSIKRELLRPSNEAHSWFSLF